MGLVAGFIAVPCIGPVLLGILTYVASKANVVAGAGLLAVYALGFGLPFVVVGVMAFKLPKSGAWMRTVKSLFGIGLLVTAFWFLRGPFPWLRHHADAVVGLALLAAGLVAGALHLHFDGSALQRLRKTAGIALAVVGSALALNAALVPDLTGWCEEGPGKACLSSVCQGHDLTVVDFSAQWCGACHELERKTFTDKKVRARLDGEGLVKVDVDENPEIADRFGVTGIPTVVFLDSECKEIGRTTGFLPPSEFLRELDSILK